MALAPDPSSLSFSNNLVGVGWVLAAESRIDLPRSVANNQSTKNQPKVNQKSTKSQPKVNQSTKGLLGGGVFDSRFPYRPPEVGGQQPVNQSTKSQPKVNQSIKSQPKVNQSTNTHMGVDSRFPYRPPEVGGQLIRQSVNQKSTKSQPVNQKSIKSQSVNQSINHYMGGVLQQIPV